MPALDDSIENLERFNAMLRDANPQVDEAGGTLEEHAQGLDALEQRAQTEISAYGDGITAVQEGLDTADREAETEVQELAQKAHDTATLVGQSTDGWVAEQELAFDQGADQSLTTLDAAFADLESQGFQALADKIDEAQTAVEQERTELVAATDAVETLLQEQGQGLDTDVQEAAGKATEAAGEIAGADRAALDQAVADAAAAMTGLDGGMETDLSGKGDAIAAAYDAWTAQAEPDGDGLIDDVRTGLTDLAVEMETVMEPAVKTASDGATVTSLPALQAEVDLHDAVLDAGNTTTDTLDPLVGDLVISKRVVDQIDQLLKAMGP